MSDAWRSTDGADHSLSALYRQELDSDLVSPGTYEFPGTAPAFAATRSGESIVLPPGGATILYREDGTAPETPGGAHPVGAVILPSAPSEAVQATVGTAEANGSSSLTIPYSFQVGASVSTTITMAFAGGYTVGEVCALAETAGSGCPHPAPAAVQGETKATTTGGSTTGLTTASVQPTPPRAHLKAPAKVLNESIVLSVSCSGSAGTSCGLKAALRTVEKLRGGKPAALAANTRSVTVGSFAANVPAGATRTITIKLNASGRALLSRFHRLPLHLTLVQALPGGSHVSLTAQNLAVTLKHR